MHTLYSIYHFLGIDMIEYFTLNSRIMKIFKKDFKVIKDLNVYANQLISTINTFDQIFAKEAFVFHILSVNCNQIHIIANNQGDIRIDRSKFYRMIILKKLYEKFSADFDNQTLKYSISEGISIFRKILFLYGEMNKYVKRSVIIKRFLFNKEVKKSTIDIPKLSNLKKKEIENTQNIENTINDISQLVPII
jgi:hypothetical protein